MRLVIEKIASAVFIMISLLSFVPDKSEAAMKSTKLKSHLAIPTLGVSAPVVAMGLTKDGKMAVPNNFTQIGWYNKSSAPGLLGSAVLGAHVDNGGKISGVFKKLKYLKTGDLIYVYDGGGNKLTYKVTGARVYDYRSKDTSTVFSNQKISSQINLITCHGTWLPKENTYNKRLVVTAELQPKPHQNIAAK